MEFIRDNEKDHSPLSFDINSYGAVKTPLVIGDRGENVVVVSIMVMLNKRWSWLCL